MTGSPARGLPICLRCCRPPRGLFFPSLSCHRQSSYVLFCETRSIIFSAPDNLLSKILILLFILVAGLLAVFGYYASSICITVVLAGFLAVLFDPLVVLLEKLHLPRGVAAAGTCSQA